MKKSALWMMAMGVVISAGSAFGQDRREREDLRHDYAQSERLRADIARDQARLDEAYRRGRWQEARAIRRDLDRDYVKLNALHRDIRQDQRDLRYERGDYRYGYR